MSTNVPVQNFCQGARGGSGMRMPVPQQATPRAHVSAGACFNCGELGHIARACSVAIGTGRVCFCCGGIGHLARVCPSRVSSSSANTNANSLSLSFSSRNFPAVSALSSAGKNEPQLFCEAFLDNMLIEQALIDTGSTYSIILMSSYLMLRNRAGLQAVDQRPP